MAHLFCKNTTFTSYDKIEKILSKTEKQIKKYITSDPDEIERLWYGQFTINLIRYFEQIRIKFITNPSTKLDLDSLIEDINNLVRSLPLDIENKEKVFEFRNSLKTRSIVALGRLGDNRKYFKLSTNEQIFNYILENTINVILDEEEYRGHLPEEDCDEILYNYNYLWTILDEHGFFVLGLLKENTGKPVIDSFTYDKQKVINLANEINNTTQTKTTEKQTPTNSNHLANCTPEDFNSTKKVLKAALDSNPDLHTSHTLQNFIKNELPKLEKQTDALLKEELIEETKNRFNLLLERASSSTDVSVIYEAFDLIDSLAYPNFEWDTEQVNLLYKKLND